MKAEKILAERIFSLDRERDSSSSSSSSAPKGATEKKEREEIRNIPPLLLALEKDFPGILKEKERQHYIQGSFIAENFDIIQIMANEIVFTPTSLYDICTIKLSDKIGRKRIKYVCEKLYVWEYLKLEVIETGLHPANVYFVHTDPAHQKILELIRERYLRNAEKVLVNSKKRAREIAKKSQVIWKEQSEAATKLRLKKEQDEKRRLEEIKRREQEEKRRLEEIKRREQEENQRKIWIEHYLQHLSPTCNICRKGKKAYQEVRK